MRTSEVQASTGWSWLLFVDIFTSTESVKETMRILVRQNELMCEMTQGDRIHLFELITAHTCISAQSIPRSLPTTVSVLFVSWFIRTYVVGTHLNCIDKSMQFKWVPATNAFIKKSRKKTYKQHQISPLLIFFFKYTLSKWIHILPQVFLVILKKKKTKKNLSAQCGY